MGDVVWGTLFFIWGMGDVVFYGGRMGDVVFYNN